jgi:tol-pal system protein YbgF
MTKQACKNLALMGALLLTGCITTAQTTSDMQEMKRRLEAIEQVTVARRGNEQAQAETRLAELNRRLADQQAELAALRVEFQGLSGRFEDATHESERVNAQLNQMRSELDIRLAGFEERMAAIEKTPSAAPAPASPVASYEKGLKLIQKENRYSDGRKELQAFIKEQPQNELVVNAIYWIGEAYYGEKQYEKAILQFQDVIQTYPKHGKAPAAMLKQALTFDVLGDKETARARLKQVVASYPNSPEAAKAAERLK